MSEIRFYHLTKTPLEKALPHLLAKVYATGEKSLVVANDTEQMSTLNDVLWTFKSIAFLPHGTANDGNSDKQPIFLTTEASNDNQASILVLLNGQAIDLEDGFFSGFTKILVMFDGTDEQAVATMRKHWADYKKKTYALTYWQQNEQGSWVEGTKA